MRAPESGIESPSDGALVIDEDADDEEINCSQVPSGI